MRIDGKKIAEGVRNGLKKPIGDLISQGITPKIAIITLGDESSWENYVRQKLRVAGELGIKAILLNLEDADEERLLKTINEIDSDPNYHGIIVQRPMPTSISKEKVINAISPEKDVDGFRPDSKFEVPVWLAVKSILQLSISGSLAPHPPLSLRERDQGRGGKDRNKLNFVVLGKGETAGGPIARGLKKMGVEPTIIDSTTENRDEILKNADVIISCVGKSRVVTGEQIKPGVILIGVGTHSEADKLRGDFEESEIESFAAAYTPTPGGVGPVNLSYLFTNLVSASEKS